MDSITAIVVRCIATAAIRGSWSTMSVAESQHARAERIEAWATGLAVRWGCDEDVRATLASEAL